MKRLISALLTFTLAISNTLPAFAQENTKANIQQEQSIAEFESVFPTNFSNHTSYVDALGNEGDIQFEVIDGNSYVEVYVNGNLTQRAYSSPSKNIILWAEYNEPYNTMQVTTSSIQSCQYTDVATDIVYNTDAEENLVQPCFSRFDPEGWDYLMTRPSNPMISGSKPCAMYSHNYDDEPDQNRYSGKRVEFDSGTAISVVVSVLSVFLTGSVTVQSIILAFGSAIVADVLSKYVNGEVCFSTQKIRYAPVIEGKLIFTDAYITKRWIVISDTVHCSETVKLDNLEYDYNRGHDVYAIAVNAQQAEVDSRT